jgi:starch synthase (maltosyl-transferring)
MNQQRVIIENVQPRVDNGRFPAKRIQGDKVEVTADLFTDGHDAISGILKYRYGRKRSRWTAVMMEPGINDQWNASFQVEELGIYTFSIEAWIDHFKTWRRDLEKRVEADQDISVDLLIGSQLVAKASQRTKGKDQAQLVELAQFLQTTKDLKLRLQLALDPDLLNLMSRNPDLTHSTLLEKELEILVERPKARFSTWYELFPRSCGEGLAHGTFKDCQKQLDSLAEMGFDVLYLPPIHPIGTQKRKGRNNNVVSEPDDCGSPWAIGNKEGGHKSIHPELGTLKDFQKLVKAADEKGIEIAMDIAFQCSPDHPYVAEHPEWFRHRPDGSVQYAENPPKKYEDIYPFDFETEKSEALWEELRSILEFWIDKGIKIFRVDNPHTKTLPFWEWVISEIREEHPEIIFLSEAFTRPKIMYRLAKSGFTQSYNYFAWRNTKYELTQYFTELNQTGIKEFFRPNAWPNTPDILTEYLQTGGEPAFRIRLILAATLCANYGIYGPAFELCENRAKEFGNEEYLDSEKYEIKDWNIEQSQPFRDLIARINRVRKDNSALQGDRKLRFHPTTNEQIICYSKQSEDESNLILVIVNLDPHHTHSGWIDLPLEDFDIEPGRTFQVHDLLSEARFLWSGSRNFVELNPRILPAHIFKIRRKIRREHDFEYFL